MLDAIKDVKEAMAEQRRALMEYVAERDAALQSQLAEARTSLAAEVERIANSAARPTATSSGVEVGSYTPQVAQQQLPNQRSYQAVPQQPFAPPQQFWPQAQVSQESIRAVVREEIGEIADKVARMPSGPSVEEVASLVRSEIENALKDVPREAGVSVANLDALANALDSRTTRLETRIDDIEKRMTQLVVERPDNAKLIRFSKDVERLEWKVEQLMDEVGFGDSLDVSKIPSNILEIVYQATLDDVVREMGKTRSLQEVGAIIETTLEEVRRNTSGSELFRFNGRRIVTEGLARSIDQGLISAKQIQTTYAELLGRLLENVPGYKPKNFRAMIKIKSQEYAVDRVTHLLDRMGNVEKIIDNMGQMIAAFSSQSNARFQQLGARLDEVAGPMLERKVDVGAFEEVRLLLNELRLAVADVVNDNSRLLAKLELGAATKDGGSAADATGAAEASAEAGAPSMTGGVAPVPELTDAEKLIVSILAEGPLSVSALRKRAESFLSGDEAKSAIEALRARGLVESSKHGKGTRLALVAPPAERPPTIVPASEAAVVEAAQQPSGAPAPEEIVYAPEAEHSAPTEADNILREGTTSAEQVDAATPQAEATEMVQQPAEPAQGEPTQPAETETPVVRAEPPQLTESHRRVLSAIGEGATMPTLRKVLDDMKYTEILVAVRMLIDGGYVTAESHGRGTTYRRVKREVSEEVKKDA